MLARLRCRPPSSGGRLLRPSLSPSVHLLLITSPPNVTSQERWIARAVSRRLAPFAPRAFASRLRSPVFVVGFNNSGKSTVTQLLSRTPGLSVYPGEGNGELWFPGMFPWVASDLGIPPIWSDPDRFVTEALRRHGPEFMAARSKLGAFQWASGGAPVLNDSGMLAALLPHLVQHVPDARVIHFVRDGRVASYVTARLEWSAMIRSPSKYLRVGCPMDFEAVLARMAAYWAWTVERVDRVTGFDSARILRLRYEDWSTNPRLAASQVAGFLGIRTGDLDSAPDRPLVDLSALILKEMSEAELAQVDLAVGNVQERLGYPLSAPADESDR